MSISVVTPTFYRPQEVVGLLTNLAEQFYLPEEVILVDGADAIEKSTELEVARLVDSLPFQVRYVRSERGTAIQRNIGVIQAKCKLIALIDDDVRLSPNFLEKMVEVFSKDSNNEIGGVVGYRTNTHFSPADAQRWRWYRRLKLLTTYEPGRYDFQSGYPINANLQPPFSGTREVDFMTTACAVWRQEVFDSGLRFDPFFRDYGVLEDAHFSLRAGREWKLLQCGDAHCLELHSPHGRIDRRRLGYKCVVNYYFVFHKIAGPLTVKKQFRFWLFQAFEMFRIIMSAIRRHRIADLKDVLGRLEGIADVVRGNY